MVKNLPANIGDTRDVGLIPGLGSSPAGGNGNPVFLPGESQGEREEEREKPSELQFIGLQSDMTEHTHAHTLLDPALS